MKLSDQLSTYFLTAAVFLLPWQTRWIFAEFSIGGGIWEYGKLSIYGVEILIILAMLFRRQPRPVLSAVQTTRFLIAFIGTAFISITLSLNVFLGLNFIFHLVSAYAFFVLLTDYRTNFRYLAAVFISGILVSSVFGWIQVIGGSSPAVTVVGLAAHHAKTLGDSVVETSAGRTLRAYGLFSHPNIFGGYLVIALISALWLLEGRSKNIIANLAVIILPATLLISFSRSAWIALALALSILLAFWQRKKIEIPVRPIIMIISVVFLISSSIFFRDQIMTRLTFSQRLETKSVEERVVGVASLKDVVAINPITGVGPRGYTLALSKLDPYKPAWDYQPVHNLFLLILAEIGFVGLAAFIALLIKTGKPVWGWLGDSKGWYAIAIFSAFLVIGLLDHYLWTFWSGLALVSLATALALRSEEEKSLK